VDSKALALLPVLGQTHHAPPDIPRAAFKALWQRCNVDHPDPADLAEFGRVLASSPGLWVIAGDLNEDARQTLLSTIGPATAREALKRGLVELAEALGQADSSALERLLIDQILSLWLAQNLCQMQFARAHAGAVQFDHSLYLEKRLLISTRRYLRAVESLARVRRLLRPGRPAVQINIGEQQVNVAGDVRAK
jgi:hypothetical protein